MNKKQMQARILELEAQIEALTPKPICPKCRGTGTITEYKYKEYGENMGMCWTESTKCDCGAWTSIQNHVLLQENAPISCAVQHS